LRKNRLCDAAAIRHVHPLDVVGDAIQTPAFVGLFPSSDAIPAVDESDASHDIGEATNTQSWLVAWQAGPVVPPQ
jgi:hypothetical protein